MATLTEEQKLFVVNRLACFDTPQQVATMLKDEWGIDVPRSQIFAYDHTKDNGRKTSKAGKKWEAIFNERRAAFNKQVEDIPIANKAYRLAQLSSMAQAAISRKNYPLAASLMEQAAKELGGMYNNTRKHELTGADGAPLPTNPSVIELVAPTIVSSGE